MSRLKSFIVLTLGNKWVHVAALIIYYALMVCEYYNFVCPHFPHLRFEWHYSAASILIGAVLVALLAVCVFKIRHSSGFAHALAVFVSVLFCVPSIVLYQFGNCSIFPCLYSLLFVFLVSSSLLKLPSYTVPTVPQRYRIPLLAALAGMMIIPFFFVFGFNFDFSVFSMGQEIYTARAAARARSTTLTSYLFGPLTKVLLPILLVIGLSRKNWILVFLSIAALLYIFLVNPHKSVFLSVFLIILFFFFDDYNLKSGIALCGVVLMIGASALFTFVSGNILPESILVRRMFFVPAQLSSVYFSFFDNNHIYLSHSILHHFIEYPYNLDPPHVIGMYMYGRTNVSCNTGFIGDGFMNFGHFGALLFTIGTAAVFRFFESLRLKPEFFGVILLTLFTFLNSAFLTSLLTHGVIFLMIVALFFLKTDKDIGENEK